MGFIVRVAGVLVGASALLATAGGISAASGDLLIGKTYSEASAVVSGLNGTPKVATVVGGRLATDDCIVASWHKSSSLDSSGNRQTGIYLINLNCSGPTASKTPPDS
jgi:hypothetical protein